MDENNVSSDPSQISQLKKYADDLAKVYNSEKQKRKELESTIRELHEARDMLVQSEKLAAIGRLTAALGHEVLNPVNIITMRLQLLERTEDLSDRAKEVLQICRNQLSRITGLTKDLCQFSRKNKEDITMTDINKVIEHVLNLIGPQLKRDIVKTDVQYHSGIPLIPLYKDKIEQVFFNIILNAGAAMSGKKNRILYIKTSVSEAHTLIEISDTGPGIDKENINKIFDPFFTTKEVDQGTGLGLYISYTIIKDHDGKIWAENNKWGGATFFIKLPILKNKQSNTIKKED